MRILFRHFNKNQFIEAICKGNNIFLKREKIKIEAFKETIKFKT